jgi:putative peptidoglycan lipid II flippase
MAGRGRLSLSTAASYVALGTGVSRVTGLLRIVALAWALGQTHVADAFNLANTTPNMLYDIVLGGVLSATFIPVFVDQLSNRTKEEAFTSISAVISVSLVVLVVSTLLALVFAPVFIDGLTALDTSSHSQLLHTVTLERADATTLLRWFVIQIAAYGVFALATALLNTQRRFVAVAWAPIVNNLVCIAVLLWFGLLVGRSPTLGGVADHHAQLVLLGLGTSLGVVLQCVALVPSLRTAGLGLLRWRWDLRDAALRTVMRLSGWTFGFVLANQAAQFVVILLAGTAGGADPVSSYTYAYAFLQMPYGIIAVTVMTVVAPDLAERWSTGQRAAFLARLSGGLRAMLALIIPSAVGMLLLAKPAVALLLGHGHSTAAGTAPTGEALAMFALGLPGFSTYLYVVRVLQSMQRTKVAFYLYLIENTINIALAVALVGPLGVRGLALSLSVAGSGPSAPKGPGRRCAGSASPRWPWGSWSWSCPICPAPRAACSSWAGWEEPSWPGSPSTWPSSSRSVAEPPARNGSAVARPRNPAVWCTASARSSPSRPRRGRLHPCPVCGS